MRPHPGTTHAGRPGRLRYGSRSGSVTGRVLLGLLLLIGIVLLAPQLIPGHDDRVPEPRDVLRTSLRDLARAQELHAARSGRYAHPDSLADYALPDGAVLLAASADSTSWSATIRTADADVTCSIAVTPQGGEAPHCR